MKNIDSCEKCGVVVDLYVLKEQSKDWDNSDRTRNLPYKDYDEFVHWDCPVCHSTNQR